MPVPISKNTVANHRHGPLVLRFSWLDYIQGGPKKSKPPPIFQKIALKIANEIRFLRKVEV